ncbi:TRAP transporter small permease [Hoeflea sp. IMCC20628]|uniref:TRAP transporter small permease n=1 Tax=Hoeflea sp. IMCC20628 TaxID=1620421 RepID=UPI0012E09B8F|nr:TRAP transporter small permease [Hoeflea sp. IMCC20628]
MVAVAACALMVVHICAEVVSRKLLNMPLPGTVTVVSYYYMIAITFMPLALVEQRDANVSVEVVTQFFSIGLQRIVEAFGWLLSSGVYALLAWVSWTDAVRQQKVGTYVMESGYQLVLWPTRYMLPIGFGLVALVLLFKIVARLTGTETLRPGQAPDQPPAKAAHTPSGSNDHSIGSPE